MKIDKKNVSPGETLPAVQICPLGSWPKAGRAAQLCDESALRAVVDGWIARGRPEILCDFEHRSEEPSEFSDTAAAAWISNLAVGPARGLVGDFTFTAAGAEAVTERSLRFLSPVFLEDAAGNVTGIKSVALTNKPNIPVEPVLNKAPSATPTVEEPQKKENPEMDRLKEILGLAPEASEEDVLAAVSALKESAEALNKEKEEAEAEFFASKHESVCNKAVLKEAYLQNKEVALKMVDGVSKAAAAQKVLNKGEATTPTLPAPSIDARARMAALPPSERAAFFKAHASEF